MKLPTITLYRCDICGHVSTWTKGQWIAHTFGITKIWEHEFHLCSSKCGNTLSQMSKKERVKLFQRIC